MPYPEHFIGPMRAELTRFGVEETRTPEAVEQVLTPGSGTVLMIINSMCGCAAAKRSNVGTRTGSAPTNATSHDDRSRDALSSEVTRSTHRS